jgi:hypothetical protein
MPFRPVEWHYEYIIGIRGILPTTSSIAVLLLGRQDYTFTTRSTKWDFCSTTSFLAKSSHYDPFISTASLRSSKSPGIPCTGPQPTGTWPGLEGVFRFDSDKISGNDKMDDQDSTEDDGNQEELDLDGYEPNENFFHFMFNHNEQ